MRIAMISEHASPLALLGGVDAGGQNQHVAELSAALAEDGHEVRVYTRRADPDVANEVPLRPGVLVEHVPAGPAEPVPKDELLPYMGIFGEWLLGRWKDGPWAPDVVHAHFWMSGLAALTARSRFPVPVVVTYHALGIVKRRYQGSADTSPSQRIGYERVLGRQADAVVAQCSDELNEMIALGVPRERINLIPSGVDSAHFTPRGPAERRGPLSRILCVGRLVERKGYADLIRALPAVPNAECVIVGGPPAAELSGDPVAGKLWTLAGSVGVAERVRLVGGVSRDRMPRWYRSTLPADGVRHRGRGPGAQLLLLAAHGRAARPALRHARRRGGRPAVVLRGGAGMSAAWRGGVWTDERRLAEPAQVLAHEERSDEGRRRTEAPRGANQEVSA